MEKVKNERKWKCYFYSLVLLPHLVLWIHYICRSSVWSIIICTRIDGSSVYGILLDDFSCRSYNLICILYRLFDGTRIHNKMEYDEWNNYYFTSFKYNSKKCSKSSWLRSVIKTFIINKSNSTESINWPDKEKKTSKIYWYVSPAVSQLMFRNLISNLLNGYWLTTDDTFAKIKFHGYLFSALL